MTFESYIDSLERNRNHSLEKRIGTEKAKELVARLRYEKKTFGFNIVPDMDDNRLPVRIIPHLYSNHLQDYLAPFHRHDCFELIYVYKGQMRNTFPNQDSVILYKGDFMLLNSRILHSVDIISENSIVFNILLSKTLLDKGLVSIINDNVVFSNFFKYDAYAKESSLQYLLFHTQSESSEEGLAQELICEFINEKPSRNSAVLSLLLLLFAKLSRYSCETKETPIASPYSKLCDMISHMIEHCSDISLEKLAKEFHYSETYLSKWITKMSGRSFRELLREIRLEQAAWKLEYTSLELSEICSAVGFRDISNFRTLFKEKYGLTPKEWRQKQGLSICQTNNISKD